MAKEKGGKLKGFFAEFKKFITRGNVLDMSVGVIVGGAFTAIVNGMSNFILKPLTNALLAVILGKDALSDVYTILIRAETAEGALDLANSIYIDWGAFINAIINFLLIAFVLFTIVKVMNRLSEASDHLVEGAEKEKNLKKRIREYRKAGLTKEQAIAKIEEEKKRAQEEKLVAEKAEAERLANEAAIAEAKANANTKLLEEIRDLLKKNN